MMRFTLQQAAQITGARICGDHNTVFEGVAIDSRAVRPAQMFVAFRGEHQDGHDYVADARKAGCAVALVQDAVDDGPSLVVADVQLALAQLAGHWRSALDVKVVGVTGSNGKTTVKNLLATILQQQAPTLATAGNYNNEIGVPLTLAQLDASHRFAVVEMGAAKAGDLHWLGQFVKPDVAILNNASAAHLQGFANLDGVIRAKAEIFDHVHDDGVCIINADDDAADFWQDYCATRTVLTFGQAPAMVHPSDVQELPDHSKFRLHSPMGQADIRLPLPGTHNIRNALAASAAAIALGEEPHAVARGLASASPEPGRLNIITLANGLTLIDDTYNANPASLDAAVTVLIEQGSQTCLILGDMAELGEDSDAVHFASGAKAARAGVTRMLTVGKHSAHAAAGFGEGGTHFDSMDALQQGFAKVADLDAVLVKGSRSMQMEQVVAFLTENGGGQSCS